MKLRYFVIPVLALFLAAGCKKKKKEADKAPAANKTAKKGKAAKKAKPAKDNKAKQPKKALPAKNAKAKVNTKPTTAPALAAPKGTPLGEIGVPKFAIAIDVDGIMKNDIVKGLLEKNKTKIEKGIMEDKSFVKVMTCLGSDAKKPYDVFKKVYVFGEPSTDNMAVLLEVGFDTSKFVECGVKHGKKAKKVKFGAKDGVSMDGEKQVLVPVTKNMLLVAGGSYLKKIKPGEGTIGKGNVASYFSSKGWIAFQANDIATKDAPGGLTKMLGKISSISANGSLNMTDKLMLTVNLDVKNPGAAKQIAAMVPPLLGAPMVAQMLKAKGIDPKLLQNLKVSAKGTLVMVNFHLNKDQVKKIVGILEAMALKKQEAKAPAMPKKAPGAPKAKAAK